MTSNEYNGMIDRADHLRAEAKDIVDIGPKGSFETVLFNRGMWLADFKKAAAEMKLICEQWQYARPCGCSDGPHYQEWCEVCQICHDIGHEVQFADEITVAGEKP